MSQGTRTIVATDSNGDPILDPDGNQILLAPGDTPIIIKGGSLDVFSVGSDVDDVDNSGQHGSHYRHRETNKRITSIEIRVLGQQPKEIDILNRVCSITVHYED